MTISLIERVKPLLDLTAASPHWAMCFQLLVALLQDDGYMESMMYCTNPRYQLANILIHMQNPRILTSVDLTMHAIPRFNEDDSP